MNLGQFILGLVGGLLIIGGAAHGQSRKLESINVSISAVVVTRAPLWIAKEMGIFAKYGLDGKVIYIGGSATSIQALLAGDIDIVNGGGLATVAAAANGAPVVIIGNLTSTPNLLVARPAITSVMGLRGKIIGATRPGTSTDFTLQRMLAKLGLDPDKDVRLLATGLVTSRDRLLVMSQGKIDATLANAVDVAAFKRQGNEVTILANAIDLGVHATEDFSTTRQMLRDHPQKLKRFLMAITESISIAKKDKALTLRVLGKYMKADSAVIESTYEGLLVRTVPDKPYPIREAIEAAIEDLAPTYSSLKGKTVSQFVDTTLFTELEKEGFFDRLKR